MIGTLARRAAEAGYAVYVVSSDKDMLQLVDGNICVLNPPKDNLICDRAKVEELLGVKPEQVIDLMALRGDSVDNVPGAPGIGDKGSVELIQQFGTLDALLERAARGAEEDVSRIAATEPRDDSAEQRAGHHRLQRAGCRLSRRRCGRRSPTWRRRVSSLASWSSPRLQKEFLSSGEAVGETKYGELTAAALEKLAKAQTLAIALSAAVRLTEAEASEAESARAWKPA